MKVQRLKAIEDMHVQQQLGISKATLLSPIAIHVQTSDANTTWTDDALQQLETEPLNEIILQQLEISISTAASIIKVVDERQSTWNIAHTGTPQRFIESMTENTVIYLHQDDIQPAVSLIRQYDGRGVVLVKENDTLYLQPVVKKILTLPEKPAPIDTALLHTWVDGLADTWLREQVEQRLARKKNWETVIAAGMYARFYRASAKEWDMQTLSLKEDAPAMRPWAWVYTLSDEQSNALIRKWDTMLELWMGEAEELMNDAQPEDTSWQKAYLTLLHRCDDLECVRVLLHERDPEGYPLDEWLQLERTGRLLVAASTHQEYYTEDRRLRRVLESAPDLWWGIPAQQELRLQNDFPAPSLAEEVETTSSSREELDVAEPEVKELPTLPVVWISESSGDVQASADISSMVTPDIIYLQFEALDGSWSASMTLSKRMQEDNELLLQITQESVPVEQAEVRLCGIIAQVSHGLARFEAKTLLDRWSQYHAGNVISVLLEEQELPGRYLF